MFKYLKKLPIYWQIIIALILGTIFGSIYSVNPNVLVLVSLKDNLKTKVEIREWDSLYVYAANSIESKKVFTKAEKGYIGKYVQGLVKEKAKNITLEIIFNKNKNYFDNIVQVKKEATIATDIKFLGNIFIRLLSFIAIPLVLASLIVGAGSLGEVKKLGRIGGTTFFLYIITTAIAISIGLLLANTIRPGERLSVESKERLIASYNPDAQEKISMGDVEVNILTFIEEIVPPNPFAAIAKGEMLQIVFFAVMIGLVINFVDKKYSDPVINFFSGLSEIMIKMVTLIMVIAPLGVFALISSTIAEFGINIITTLFWYVLTVLLGLFLHSIIVYPTLVKVLGKLSPITFFKGMRNAMAIAFSTSSSAATLPVTFDCVENNLKVPNKIAGFVLPLGATINMDGTALYQGVATIFIAQVYGVQLDLAAQLTIIFTAVLASIGTAPVPGVGLIMLIMILRSVNIPAEGIALILGVDRFLDMCRTIPNITGDAAVSVSIWGLEKRRLNKIEK